MHAFRSPRRIRCAGLVAIAVAMAVMVSAVPTYSAALRVGGYPPPSPTPSSPAPPGVQLIYAASAVFKPGALSTADPPATQRPSVFSSVNADVLAWGWAVGVHRVMPTFIKGSWATNGTVATWFAATIAHAANRYAGVQPPTTGSPVASSFDEFGVLVPGLALIVLVIVGFAQTRLAMTRRRRPVRLARCGTAPWLATTRNQRTREPSAPGRTLTAWLLPNQGALCGWTS